MPENARCRNTLIFELCETRGQFLEKTKGYRAFGVALSRIVGNDASRIKQTFSLSSALRDNRFRLHANAPESLQGCIYRVTPGSTTANAQFLRVIYDANGYRRNVKHNRRAKRTGNYVALRTYRGSRDDKRRNARLHLLRKIIRQKITSSQMKLRLEICRRLSYFEFYDVSITDR